MAIQFQITITMDDTGNIGVNAPMHDKVLCYGLLGVAHDIIAKYQPPASPIVQVPPGTRVPNTHQ